MTAPSSVLKNSIVDTNADNEAVCVTWADGQQARFPHFWLRETCPEDGNSLTGQRLLSLCDIPDDIRPQTTSVEEGNLKLIWPDGHVTIQDSDWLRSHAGSNYQWPVKIEPWDNRLDPKKLMIDFDTVMNDDDVLFDTMVMIAEYGLARIQNMPFDGMTEMAKRIGYLHDTNYGLIMDVKSELKPWFRVMARDSIPPHTDNCYRYTPTGVTFFHCVDQIKGKGGESFYVDGLRLAERMREECPEEFRLLVEKPLTFHRQMPSNTSLGVDPAYYRVEAPVFRTDSSGRIVGVRYHPRTVAPLPANHPDALKVYKARKAFEALSLDPSMRIEYQATIGECTIYDNQRVLHARESFENATEGTRRFRQCHIDREALHSKIRVLGLELGRDIPEESMLPGASF
jgi:gamma-butyrobetaine dioxygenase